MEKREGYKKTEIGWIPEDWDVNTIDYAVQQILDFRGKTPKKLGMDWGGGDIPALSANNVKMGFIDFSAECNLGSEELYQTWMTKGDLAKGDVLMTMEAPLGNVTQVPDNQKYILSQRVIAIKVEGGFIFDNYFNHFLGGDFFQKILFQNATGTTAKGIQQKRLVKLPCIIPPLPEQKKIASILTTVDDKISSIDHQIQQTEQLKKGLMEKLLTEGIGHTEFKETKIGRIPKGWEFYELNDISTVTRLAGYEYSSVWEEFDSGDILALKGYNIGKNKIIDKGFKYISNSLSLKLNRSRLYKGDIVFPCVGSIGNAVVINEDAKYHINQNIAKITPNSGIDPTFLVQFFLSHLCQKEVRRFNATTSQPNVLVGSLRKFRIGIPSSIEEQKQIATILSTVDDKIDILTQKKTQYQTLKKGLSQQLLTGQMRVKI